MGSINRSISPNLSIEKASPIKNTASEMFASLFTGESSLNSVTLNNSVSLMAKRHAKQLQLDHSLLDLQKKAYNESLLDSFFPKGLAQVKNEEPEEEDDN